MRTRGKSPPDPCFLEHANTDQTHLFQKYHKCFVKDEVWKWVAERAAGERILIVFTLFNDLAQQTEHFPNALVYQSGKSPRKAFVKGERRIGGWKCNIKYKRVSVLLLIQSQCQGVPPTLQWKLFWREPTGFSCLSSPYQTGRDRSAGIWPLSHVDGADLKAWNMSSRSISEHQETTAPLSHLTVGFMWDEN